MVRHYLPTLFSWHTLCRRQLIHCHWLNNRSSFIMSITSVIASVVATQVFGGVWFTLLSEPWMQGLGKTHKDFKSMGHTSLVLSGIAMFALAVFMSNTLRPFFGVQTVEEAIHFALRVSVAGALLQIPHNTYEGKGWSTYLVNIGYDTICLLITCVLTVVM